MTEEANDPPNLARLIQLMQKSHPERSVDEIRSLLLDHTKPKNYPDPMLPPWEEMPHIPKWPSIGWRMGGGEDYLRDFRKWLRALPEEELANYVTAYPEPQGFIGLYAAILRSS